MTGEQDLPESKSRKRTVDVRNAEDVEMGFINANPEKESRSHVSYKGTLGKVRHARLSWDLNMVETDSLGRDHLDDQEDQDQRVGQKLT